MKKYLYFVIPIIMLLVIGLAFIWLYTNKKDATSPLIDKELNQISNVNDESINVIETEIDSLDVPESKDILEIQEESKTENKDEVINKENTSKQTSSSTDKKESTTEKIIDTSKKEESKLKSLLKKKKKQKKQNQLQHKILNNLLQDKILQLQQIIHHKKLKRKKLLLDVLITIIMV